MISGTVSRLANQHRPQIMQALLGTIAALCALAAAMFLKLENPYWAAMTALIVIQPTRGMLFEKSVYRLLGTAIGAVAGMGLLLYTRSPLLLTLALALWLSACVGIGNLLHGQRSYAALMAACTCAIIAMSGYQDPPHLHAIALGRIACIIIGILAATLITALFTPHNPKEELFRRLHQLSGKTVAWLALHLRQGPAGTLIRQEQNILIEIAELEGMLDASCAGRRGSRQRKRHLRGLLAALLSLLAIGRLTGTQLSHHNKQDRRHDYWQGMLAGHLEVVADRLEHAETIGCTEEMAAVVAETKAHLPLLGKNLAEIVNVLTLLLHDYSSMTSSTAEPARNRLIRHRDWQEARRAAIRAGLGIALTGLVWSLTGWSKGPLMLMAVSIMISIYFQQGTPGRVCRADIHRCSNRVGVGRVLPGRVATRRNRPGAHGCHYQPLCHAGGLCNAVPAHRRCSNGRHALFHLHCAAGRVDCHSAGRPGDWRTRHGGRSGQLLAGIPLSDSDQPGHPPAPSADCHCP